MVDNPLIIAGSGRSGTTWVSDALAEANDLRTIFEPLNPLGIKGIDRFAYRYLKMGQNDPELEHFMRNIFSGSIKDIWPNTRIIPSHLQLSSSQIISLRYTYNKVAKYNLFLSRYLRYLLNKSKRPITKFIRANLMLDWIKEKFAAKIAYIVRHPGAVAASKISATGRRNGYVWDYDGPFQQEILRRYKKDEQLWIDYLHKYEDILAERFSAAAGHTLIWCIENMVPIKNAQQKNLNIFFYEDLVRNPEKEFDRMVKVLGLERSPVKSQFVRPSQQAAFKMRNKAFDEKQLSMWMKTFTPLQINEIDNVLKIFHITIYDAHESLPFCGT